MANISGVPLHKLCLSTGKAKAGDKPAKSPKPKTGVSNDKSKADAKPLHKLCL